MEREGIQMSKDVEVDGYRYKIVHPQVETAWSIGIELTKLIGPSVASMVKAAEGKSELAAAVTQAVSLLLQKVDPATSMVLIRKILRNVEVQGAVDGENKKFILDEAGIKSHFHGRMGAMLNLLGETLAFTHTDFFSAMKEGVAKMMTKMDEDSKE